MDRDRCLALGFDLDAFLETPPSTTGDRKMATSLYVVQCGDYIKVGIAGNVARRITDFQIGNPFPIAVLRQVEFGSRLHALLVERTIHAVLADERHYGEWFVCTAARASEVADLVGEAMGLLAVEFERKDRERRAYWNNKYQNDPKYRAKIDREREQVRRSIELHEKRDRVLRRAESEFNDENRGQYPEIDEEERWRRKLMLSLPLPKRSSD